MCGCVSVWCVDGEALSPVEPQSFISVWNILVLDEEVKALSPSVAGNPGAYLSGNGAAVENRSVCVCLGFSGSSKIHAGPHPVLSVHCVP